MSCVFQTHSTVSHCLRNRFLLLRLYKTAHVASSYLYKVATSCSAFPAASLPFLKSPMCFLTPLLSHFLFSLPTKLLPQHFAQLAHSHSVGLGLNVISLESSSLTVQDIPTLYVVTLDYLPSHST